MNFAAYIERQKNIIRHRRDGETYLLQKGEEIPLSETDRLLYELQNLKGLSRRERVDLRREAV